MADPASNSDRSTDDGVLPLADDAFVCLACGREYIPEGGESRCPACVHVHDGSGSRGQAAPEAGADASRSCVGCGYDLRGLAAFARCPECGRGPDGSDPSKRPVVDRLAVRPSHVAAISGRRPVQRREELIEHRPIRAAAVCSLLLLSAGLHGLAIVALASSWVLRGTGALVEGTAWILAAIGSLVLWSPVVLPPESKAPRYPVLLAFFGALAAAVGVGFYLIRFAAPNPLHALADLVAIVGACAYLVGCALRLGDVAAWTGHDPSDRSAMAASLPPVLMCFAVALMYFLTMFFRRPFDHATFWAIGFIGWMFCRHFVVAWHAYEAGASRIDRDRRAQRFLEKVGAVCGACGHSREGVAPHRPCPECGARS
jgi:rubrerythrin